MNSQDLPLFAPLFEKQFDGLTLSSREGASSEDFIRRAHELAVSWLPSELQTKLEGFLDEETGPSVLVVRGLPVDEDPPSTPYEVGNTTKKPGKQMSEAWVLAISKILGQPVTYEVSLLVAFWVNALVVCRLLLRPHLSCPMATDIVVGYLGKFVEVCGRKRWTLWKGVGSREIKLERLG